VERHWADEVGHDDYAAFRRVLERITKT
jgi:hypothetical protein